jgi:hypothetical protein
MMVGCSSGADDGLLDLESDDGTAVAEEPDPTPEVADDPDPADEAQLYPPLPELEPDPAADVPTDDQQFFLDLHAAAYEASQRSFATATLDPDLGLYVGGDALAEIEATIEAWSQRGVVQLSPDAEIRWLAVEDEGDGRFSVTECSVAGPRTGLYDATTGEAVELLDSAAATLIRTTYSLIESEGGPDYRALEVTAYVDPERCDVA